VLTVIVGFFSSRLNIVPKSECISSFLNFKKRVKMAENGENDGERKEKKMVA
jgi:hypothetical protein